MILEFVTALRKQIITRGDLNRLIEYCGKIALSYITQRYSRRGELPAPLNFQDLAIDIIADLFTLRPGEKNYVLQHSLELWQPYPETEAQAAFMLQRIIWNRAEQHIALLLKANDPHFARILKQLNYQIKLNGFFKISHFGTIYIIKPERVPVYGPLIDAERFNDLPGDLFRNSRNELLPALFEYLEQNIEFYPAIPFNPLIKRIQILTSTRGISPDSYVIDMDQFQFRNLIDYSLAAVTKHLDRSYIKCGKISPATGEVLKRALVTMCEDLKDGGIQRGLYDYLQAHLPHLDRDEFYQKYRNIFDYLFRILRREIRKELMT